jgi:hypothetical protein
MTIHFDTEAYCRNAADIRKRLWGSQNVKKAKPAVIAQEPVVAPPQPARVALPPKPFVAHVAAYKASSKFARSPKTYLERRALELGFSARELRGIFTFAPFNDARRLLAWELRKKFGLSLPKIGSLLKRHHTCILKMLSKPAPVESDVTMRLSLPTGKTYLAAFEDAYFSGAPYDEICASFRIPSTSIRKIVVHMGWPARRTDLVKANAKRWAKYEEARAWQ